MPIPSAFAWSETVGNMRARVHESTGLYSAALSITCSQSSAPGHGHGSFETNAARVVVRQPASDASRVVHVAAWELAGFAVDLLLANDAEGAARSVDLWKVCSSAKAVALADDLPVVPDRSQPVAGSLPLLRMPDDRRGHLFAVRRLLGDLLISRFDLRIVWDAVR